MTERVDPTARAGVRGQAPIRVGLRRISRKSARPGLVWKLHPQFVNELEQKVGKFTKEAFLPPRSTTSHLPSCYRTSAEFMKSELSGKDHVLMVGPDPQLGAAMRYFKRARGRNPNLHGTFVLPGAPSAPWLKRVPGHLVATYAPGAELLTTQPGSVGPGRVPHSVCVFTTRPMEGQASTSGRGADEPVKEELPSAQALEANALDSPETSQQVTIPEATLPDLSRVLITFAATINGKECRALIDSGASDDFVDRTLVAAHDWATHKPGGVRYVRMANGVRQDASHSVPQADVRVGDWRGPVELLVTPLQKYGFILGKPWLTKHNPAIDWATNTLTIQMEGGPVLLKGEVTPAPKGVAAVSALSAMQLKRAIPKGKDHFFGIVREVDGELTLAEMEPGGVPPKDELDEEAPRAPPPIQSSDERARVFVEALEKMDCPGLTASQKAEVQRLLKSYEEVLSGMPPGYMPPQRSFDHPIPLTEGAQPFFHSTYRMSPAELDELKKQLTDLLERVSFSHRHHRSDRPFSLCARRTAPFASAWTTAL